MNAIIRCEIDNLMEDYSAGLYDTAMYVIDKARSLPSSGLVSHQRDNILNGLCGTIQLYKHDLFERSEVDSMILSAIKVSLPKIKRLEQQIKKHKTERELNKLRLQDKYEWWG